MDVETDERNMELAKLCHDLVAISSESHHEKEISEFIEDLLQAAPELKLYRIGDNLVATSWEGRGERVIIAGHLDTVPVNGSAAPVRIDGRILGRGSADMKSGLAVMIGLASRAKHFNHDLTFIFYAREEVASKYSGLLEVEQADRNFIKADAAILMEPTSCRIEGGCQGTIRVRISMGGKSAHTARPWIGVNAIHRLGAVISKLDEFGLSQPIIDGLTFRESLQAVHIEGGTAGNVVPSISSVVVNYRFSPDKSIDDALRFLMEYFRECLDEDSGDSLELIEGVAGALPALDNPIFADLARISNLDPIAKLGWTDVAFFVSRGVPATNFGPGDPLVAHTQDEFVEIAEIDSAFDILSQLL